MIFFSKSFIFSIFKLVFFIKQQLPLNLTLMGKIPEKAVRRSLFLTTYHCFWNADSTKTRSPEIRFYRRGKDYTYILQCTFVYEASFFMFVVQCSRLFLSIEGFARWSITNVNLKREKKQCEGVYFRTYYHISIQQKLTSPELLFSVFAGWAKRRIDQVRVYMRKVCPRSAWQVSPE